MPKEIVRTWDDARLKHERLARIQEQMSRRGIGAMYLHEGINARYVLNTMVPGGSVFVPIEGDATALVRPRDMGYVSLAHEDVRLTAYTSAETWDVGSEDKPNGFVQSMLDLMAERGVAGEVLAVDELDAGVFHALDRAGIRTVSALQAIEHARAVKTQDEIVIYRTIGEQYAHTFSAFRDAVRPGISENELAGVVVNAWYEAAGEDIAQLNVCAGENMNPWRRWPTQRTLKQGEFVGVDLHGRGANGLRGDSSRTFFVGDDPSAEQRDLYRRAYEYLWAAADVFRAGRSFDDVLRLAPEVPQKYRERLYDLQIAHGIGIHYAGYPLIEKPLKSAGDETLQPNQVMSIECYFGSDDDPDTVKLEEMVVVRDGPPEILGPKIPFDEHFGV